MLIKTLYHTGIVDTNTVWLLGKGCHDVALHEAAHFQIQVSHPMKDRIVAIRDPTVLYLHPGYSHGTG